MTGAGAAGPDPLAVLAERHRVLRSFPGEDGREHRAEPEVLVAVLGALGVAIERPDQAAEVLAAEAAGPPPAALAPVVVHWTDRRSPVTVTLRAGARTEDGWITLELEGGPVVRHRLRGALGGAIGPGPASGAGAAWERHRVMLGELPGPPIPPGYHRLRVEVPGAEAEALVVAAPRLADPDRGWGAFLPLHALRTADDAGIGTYRDLGALCRLTVGRGGSFVGTLPLYPTFLTEPLDPSPYRPVTRLAWSELYLDLRGLPELAGLPEAARELGAVDRLLGPGAPAAPGGSPGLVDHRAIAARLRRVLRPAARALMAEPSARRDAFAAFCAARPDLEAYARFQAAVDTTGVGWPDWPRAEPGRLPDGAVDQEDVRDHLYAQWVADQQLAAAAETPGCRLYLDYPVGVHPEGFDPWRYPRSFATRAHGGAPPDAFFAEGQDWSFHPLHPEGERADGYRYTVAALRHAFSRAAILRLDHVMGLHRLYWIPEGFDAAHGAYVRYHDEELRALAALEAHRAGAAVVGEDLGTVPPEVREHMVEDGMLRTWVFQFEASPDEPLALAPADSLAALGTHDLPRFAAFWTGQDVDERQAEGRLSPAEADQARQQRAELRAAVLDALAGRSRRWRPPAGRPEPTAPAPSEGWGPSDDRALSDARTLSDDRPLSDDEIRQALVGCLLRLAESPARLVLVDLEDLWLERQPQNRPGTGPEADNWRRRSARTLEELAEDPFVAQVLADLGQHRLAAAGRPR